MKKILFAALAIFCNTFCECQTVKNTSYTTQTGEKVLRLEMIVPVNKLTAWQLFTNDSQLQKWIAPLAHIELKTGGYILTNYDKNRSLSDTTSIKLGIINYLENELITFKVTLNNNFAMSVRNEDNNLQELVQFIDFGNNKTKIISSMIGWGQGSQWDKTYNFFVTGNKYTYEEMSKLFK